MEKRKLDPHQEVAVRFIERRNGTAGLGMSPGTGKTIVAIRTAVTPSLVICRRDDFLTWQDELQMEGVPARYIWTIETNEPPGPPLRGRWYMVSYDRVKNPAIMKWIMQHQWGCLISDEFHYVKRWKSARTKANFKATRHIKRRLGLTGSAITNHVRDVFALCKLLDNGKLFGDNEWWFLKNTHLRVGKGWFLRRGIKEQIRDKMKKLWYYVHEDDVLKLPPCRPVSKGVPMTGMQRRHYNQILDDWETELADGTRLEIDYVIVQLQKLKQIAGGFLYDEDKKAHWLRNNKMPFLFKIIKDPDYYGDHPKIVVWCSYTAEIKRVAKEAAVRGIKYVTFYGSNRKKKNEARQQFRDDPSVRLFIGQVDSGVGMNELIIADVAIWYSNSLKVVSKQQSSRRNRRRGSEIHDRIHHVNLCTENTLDFKLAKSIQAAMNLAHDILEACKAGDSPRRFLT